MAVRSRFSFVDVRIVPVIRGSVEEEKFGRSEGEWEGGEKLGEEEWEGILAAL